MPPFVWLTINDRFVDDYVFILYKGRSSDLIFAVCYLVCIGRSF